MKYLLGIDFGGGSSKSTLIDTNGNIIAENSVEYPTLYPKLGFCEQNPDDWCKALCENTLALIEKSKIDSSDILAVAIDSATHTWVACDEDFKVLFPAIHWTDSRSRLQAAKLREEYGSLIFEKTFHKPDTIWTLPQILWVKENNSEAFDKIKHIFFEKDYIRYFLTGTYCTDYIDAEGSMLLDMKENKWSKEICDIVGIDLSVLPMLCHATDVVGSVTQTAEALTGLKAGTPVICGTTDTVMEVFASGAVRSGDTTVKLATAGRICVITDKPCPDRDVVNYSHIVEGLWYPGSATKAAASSLRWYRDTFGGDYRELDERAEEISVGSEGLIYHPYINGELTPYADPELCGSFIGIRATHTKAHFTRSVLEGVAYSLRHSKMKLEELGINCAKRATLIGGGAKSRLWQQIVADCLDIELNVTVSSDSSLGSAMLAGLAVGVFKTPEDAVEKCIKVKSSVKPIKENTEKYEKLFEEYVRVHDALAPIYRERNQ
ncbi:MAG: xylulokinase [Ruminococcaceae bacterium]|nr:xylulokinase [Oscillospiraceae bacterium]